MIELWIASSPAVGQVRTFPDDRFRAIVGQLVDWRTRGNSLVGRAQPSKAEAQFRYLFPAP